MPIAHSKLTARAEDVRVENESRCDEPRVVLSHAPRRAPLQQRTTPRVRHLKPLNREALERFHGHGGVSGTFENFFDCDDGDH